MEDKYIPLPFDYSSSGEVERNALRLFQTYNRRRSVREFSDAPVSKETIEALIRTAGTAPSGANKQPWMFCAVSNPVLKSQIREAAEKEEYENYHGRMSEEWLHDLQVLGTDWNKPFLEKAPWLVVLFRKSYDEDGQGRRKNYYVQESVGIAAGFLISAIHQAGLVTLTHTPSPMNFLSRILNRPENEKAYLLLPVGYPAKGAVVPDIHRKSLEDIAEFYD